MRKSSWILLGFCAMLIFGLGCAYVLSRPAPQALTAEQAAQIVKQMQDAVHQKNVNTIMSYISPDPDVKVAGLDQFHIRRLLVSAFHRMDNPKADVTNLVFTGGTDDATVTFDLSVRNDGPNQLGEDYKGQVQLDLKRVDIPHLFGLYHTKEWRIVGGTSTGADPTAWGDD